MSQTEPPPPSKKDAILAARRASVAPSQGALGKQPTPAPQSKRTTAKQKPRTRLGFVVLGVLLLIAVLVALGNFVKQTFYARSDAGRVHAQLLAFEFGPREPAAREAAFAEIDRMGASAGFIVIDKLTDGSLAEQGSSRSTHTVQQLAHLYLMHVATVSKAQPPKQAEEIEKAIFDGTAVSANQWAAARDAWRAWYSEQQARGALPK